MKYVALFIEWDLLVMGVVIRTGGVEVGETSENF